MVVESGIDCRSEPALTMVVIPDMIGDPYTCGGPRSVCTGRTSLRKEGASYPAYDSDNRKNGVPTLKKSTAHSDWKYERMSMTAYCESL